MIRTLPLLVLPLPAMAELNVVTDIAPIHSITAQIMGDTGTPTLLLPTDADVHHFQFRPSDAQALQDADVVIMVGPTLTPWLADPVASLTSSAAILSLEDTNGWNEFKLSMRDGHADHDKHADHDDHDDHTADKDHDHDHDDHDDHADHDDHDEHADHDDHAADATDPHGWLDPNVTRLWAAEIAQQLSDADPDNAAVYAANAQALNLELIDLAQNLTETLAQAGPIIWPHDGYQYLEARFNIQAAGRIADSHAATPGPERISELQTLIADAGVTCILTDREINGAWVDVIRSGTDAGTAFIDSIGADLDAGPDLYPAMMRTLAQTIADC